MKAGWRFILIWRAKRALEIRRICRALPVRENMDRRADNFARVGEKEPGGTDRKMRRCIICGNIGDDNSTTCEVCGNPYVDIAENASDLSDAGEFHEQGMSPVVDEVPQVSQAEAAEGMNPSGEAQGSAGGVNPSGEAQRSAEGMNPSGAAQRSAEGMNPSGTAQGSAEGANSSGAADANISGARPARQAQAAAGARPARRMRTSGPQIYGQAGSAPSGAQYSQQGMVRRNVQGRPAGTAQGGRPVQQAGGNSVQGQMGRPAGQAQRGPVNPAQGQMGRPAGQAQRGPMNPAQSRPVNQMQGQMARPVNPQNMGGRPMMQSPGRQSGQIMETARDMLRSPLFLLIAILHTAYLAGSIAAIFMSQMNYSQAVRLIKSMSLPAQVSGYTNTIITLLSKLDSGALVANLVLHIPDILFCVGLWLIFIMAMSAKENMSGIGFGFTKATVIINMVVSCIVMLAALIISVAVVIAAWVSGTTSVIVVSAVVLVLVIIVTMMVIMYHFCYLATLKTCRLNGDTGEEYGSVSGFVAVIHILLALFSVINLLSGIVNSEISNIVSEVGSIGWMLLFAIWIFLYRGKMDELEA